MNGSEGLNMTLADRYLKRLSMSLPLLVIVPKEVTLCYNFALTASAAIVICRWNHAKRCCVHLNVRIVKRARRPSYTESARTVAVSW